MNIKPAVLVALAMLALQASNVLRAGESASDQSTTPREVIDSDKGEIDGDRYKALIVSSDGSADLLLFRTDGRQAYPIWKMEFVGDPRGYQVKIARNSFYLRYETGHHGTFFSTYQFKKIGAKFFLVGLESQSMSSCIYSGDWQQAEDERCQSLEMWAGTSVNFLTSRAQCWLQTFNLAHDEQSKDWASWKAALEDFNLGIRSSKAKSRSTKLPRSKLVALDHFDLYNFQEPGTCYFDYKGGFHTS